MAGHYPDRLLPRGRRGRCRCRGGVRCSKGRNAFYLYEKTKARFRRKFHFQNIVACGAGFVDGLKLGDNTKAAVIRLGLMEMIKFVDVFYPGAKLSTFFESCGVADLITTCYGGRNRKVSEAFVTSGKSIKELEDAMLNGQKLQGPITAEEVNFMLKNKGMEDK